MGEERRRIFLQNIAGRLYLRAYILSFQDVRRHGPGRVAARAAPVHADNKDLYEIILRCPYEGRLTNINVILTKLGYAECVTMRIYEGESEQQPAACESNALLLPPSMSALSSSAASADATSVASPDDPSTTPKVSSFLMKVLKPTEIELEVQELVKDFMPSKVKSTPPANSVKCRVTNVVSPSEIWLQDLVDADKCYEQ